METTQKSISNGTYTVRGADGTDVIVRKGDWYINTKARARRMMANSLSSDARRVHACLELATMGFSQELAVTMENGEQRPLTPTDIQKQTGLPRQEVRRGLDDLEVAGLAARRADDENGLRRGHVLIYSWASPRSTGEEKEIVGERAYKLPSWFPESCEALKPFLSHYKIRLTEEFVGERAYISELEELAHAYKEFTDRAARTLEKVCAHGKTPPPSLYERNGKEHGERNNNNTRSEESPAPADLVVVVHSAESEPIAPVLTALEKYGATTPKAAEKLVARCREVKPGCTPTEIVGAIQKMAATFGPGTKTPIGVLLTQIPQALKPRAPTIQRKPVDIDRTALNEEGRRAAIAILNDPESSERDRELAREVLENGSLYRSSNGR